MLAVLMLTQAAAFSPAVFTDGEATDTAIQPKESTVVLNEGASVMYNIDKGALTQDIINNLIDWDNSSLPAKESVDSSNFDVKYSNYSLKPTAKTWKDVSSLTANDKDRYIRITFLGNDEYSASEPVCGAFKVDKSDIRVRVHVNSTSIYVGDKLDDGFVSTSPADSGFKFITVFAGKTSGYNETGATSGVISSIYVQLDKGLSIILSLAKSTLNPILKGAIDRDYNDIKANGISVGELKTLCKYISDTDSLGSIANKISALKDYVETANKVLDIITKLPGVVDKNMIYFGTPAHAGVYTVAALALNDNYDTAIGMGTLTVKMRTIGMKIDLNEILSRRVISADQASILASGEKGAVATLSCYNGEDVDQANLHYLYSGVTKSLKPYSSTTEFPTEPGRYTVTVVTLGGDYLASPVTRSFQIK